jgi:thiosulfate dehydrogenase [quinone] large subunit
MFTRIAAICGMFLILTFYFAYPPFIGLPEPPNLEGNYLIVNKTLIEGVALWVLYLYPTSGKTGLAGLFSSSIFE